MSFNSRLFTIAKFRAIVEVTDDLANACQEAADFLADYENAGDTDDPTAEREQARDGAWAKLGEILDEARRLAAMRDSLYEV